MAKGAVTATAWISVTLVIIAMLWFLEIEDFLLLMIIVFLLLAMPFILTLVSLMRKDLL